MPTPRKSDENCRWVATQHDAFGRTYTDLAAELGVSERTVRRWAGKGRELIIEELRARGEDQATQLIRDLHRREARIEHLVRMATHLEGTVCHDEDCFHTSAKKCTAVRNVNIALGYWNAAARLEEDLSKLRRQYTTQIEHSGTVVTEVDFSKLTDAQLRAIAEGANPEEILDD